MPTAIVAIGVAREDLGRAATLFFSHLPFI